VLAPDAIRWFKDRRGIERETLEAFGVSSDGPAVTVFPYPQGAKKYRKGWDKIEGDPDSRKFWWDPPTMAGQVPFLPPDFERVKRMFLLEGETDTMALWQNAPDAARQGIVGLSGLNAWKDEYVEDLFGEASLVYLILDADDPYENPKAYDANQRARAQIRKALGKKVRPVTLPQGIKDVAEFFQRYDWAAMAVLLNKASQLSFPFKPLDLTAPLPKYDFLVENLILRGEIVMNTGEPGVGKSWLAQDLAVAIASGRPTWLGNKLFVPPEGSHVMYVDQENPLVTARNRLNKLGLSPEDAKRNMHYLWFQGVRLDSEPERLIEHAELWEPELIVLDSFSRVHFKNENSAEDMNPVINAGIYPLARELGATVIVIHHLPKEGKGPRGSTAIQAANDLTLEVRPKVSRQGAATGTYMLLPDKLRNVPPWGAAIEFERREEEDGRIVIEPATREEPW
jgi:hypothetical protein